MSRYVNEEGLSAAMAAAIASERLIVLAGRGAVRAGAHDALVELGTRLERYWQRPCWPRTFSPGIRSISGWPAATPESSHQVFLPKPIASSHLVPA